MRCDLSSPETVHTGQGARWDELFRHLEKAFYMTEADELKTLSTFAPDDPAAARVWAELIRQRRSGRPH